MTTIKTLLITLLFVALGAGVAAYLFLGDETPEISTATVYPSPVSLPDFSLVDAQNQPVGRDFFEGQLDLVFFGFTHCPDICPNTLQVLSLARRALAEDGVEPLPRVVLVSVDPERDTPDVMAEYTGYFGEGVAGITGTVEEISKLTSATGIYFNKVGDETENYNVDHSGVVLVINDAAEVVGLFSYPQKTEQVAADYRGLLAL